MPYLFYGENTYSLKEKLKDLKEKFFLSPNAELNFIIIDGEEIDRGTFLSSALAAPFLASKRLVIIRNVLLKNRDNELKKYIAKNLATVPESTVLIFAEFGLPDQRSALFKALNQPKKSQNFTFLAGKKLDDWIKEKSKLEGAEITPAALVKLTAILGGDLDRIDKELNKIILYKKSLGETKIEEKDIEKFVQGEAGANVFEFIDALASRNPKKATEALSLLLESGQNELYILSMIVYQYRNLLSVSSLSSKGMRSGEIAKIARLHPFVVNKTLSFLGNYGNKNRLKETYSLLQKIDSSIKSGLLEPRLALFLLVAKLTN